MCVVTLVNAIALEKATLLHSVPYEQVKHLHGDTFAAVITLSQVFRMCWRVGWQSAIDDFSDKKNKPRVLFNCLELGFFF